MNYREIGQVIRSDEGCFLWTIDSFLSYTCYEKSAESPAFIFSGSSCRLNLFYPSDREKYLELCFAVIDKPPPKLHVKLGMRTGYKGRRESRSRETDIDGRVRERAWMQWSEMLKRRCEILQDGRLTVFCELRRIRVNEEISSKLQEQLSSKDICLENETSEKDSDDDEDIDPKIIVKLQKDLKTLLFTGEDSDVTVKVQGKAFPVHRNILRTRSPVFKSMFSHEMVEKQSGVVVIEDCDPVTFPDFLKYLYTGSTRHISAENVHHLYTASDKYGIEALKRKCADFMKSNLSVGMFCETITLALQHSETELVQLATEFFCANVSEIAKTVKWQTFLHKNTTVGNELFLKAVAN